MKSTDVGKMMNVVQRVKVCKPYEPPKLLRLSPALLKRLLSRDTYTSDNELQQLIESVDQLRGAKDS
jgi:hypothetical protein